MKPFSDSSKLANRISVERRTGTSDALGNPQWETYMTAYAGVVDRVGNTIIVAAQNRRESSARTLFILRDTTESRGILPTMRIVWRTFVFEIISCGVFTDDRNFIQFETERKF